MRIVRFATANVPRERQPARACVKPVDPHQALFAADLVNHAFWRAFRRLLS